MGSHGIQKIDLIEFVSRDTIDCLKIDSLEIFFMRFRIIFKIFFHLKHKTNSSQNFFKSSYHPLKFPLLFVFLFDEKEKKFEKEKLCSNN